MTFKLTVKFDPVGIEFEAGSLAEAHAILTSERKALDEIFADFGGHGAEGEAADPAPAAGGAEPGKPKRTRRTKAEMEAANAAPPAPPVAVAPPTVPAPPVAVAPPPIPVPTAPGTGNSNTEGLEVPAYLKPAAPPAAVAPPPPPVPPSSPPAASATKDAVVAELRKRGPAIVEWLSNPDWQGGAFVTKGASFDEAITAMTFIPDDRLAPLAAALGIK